jgi:hypothetical protein
MSAPISTRDVEERRRTTKNGDARVARVATLPTDPALTLTLSAISRCERFNTHFCLRIDLYPFVLDGGFASSRDCAECPRGRPPDPRRTNHELVSGRYNFDPSHDRHQSSRLLEQDGA